MTAHQGAAVIGCKSCIVDELIYEVRFAGEWNRVILPTVIRQLDRVRALRGADRASGLIRVSEAGMREVIDFCRDHGNPKRVSFRLEGQQWLPLSEAGALLNLAWVDEIIRSGRVVSHFQPIVTAEGEIYGHECLSRFQRGDGSTVYPNEVFAAARSRGRMYALDRLCRLTAVKHAPRVSGKLFINFIPTSIYSPEFCLKSTVQLANGLGVDPSRFVFEVVETEKVDDLDHLKRILAYYKQQGFRYALDDVGAGHSTPELLGELKPNYMKLDREFVHGVARDEAKQSIACQLLTQSVAIGAIPLAEGVELAEDYEWLKKQGYLLFQGYLFGKPEPL